MGGEQSSMSIIFLYGGIFLIWYFLVIKPQRSKQKEQAEMKKNLKKNDQVVTTAGIHGTIVNVKETTVVVRVDDNVKLEFDKESIYSVAKAAASNA